MLFPRDMKDLVYHTSSLICQKESPKKKKVEMGFK